MPIHGVKGADAEESQRKLHALSVEEQKQLAIALEQMKARGLKIPTQSEIMKPYGHWSVGPNGYFLKGAGTEYIPNAKQELFIKSIAARSAMFGGRGSGKTGAGAQKSLLKVKAGNTGLIFSPDFEGMRTSTWPELRQWIPWDMVVPAHRYRREESWEAIKPFALAFLNGAKLYIKGLKDPESARGPNVNFLWYDEAGRDRTGMGWKIATGGVRIGDDSQAFITTTPKGTLHWTYEFFIKQEFTEEVLKYMEEYAKDRPFIDYVFTTIEENKHNLSPDFYATMLATYPSGWLRQQELEGQFANEEGALGTRKWFEGHYMPYPPAEVKMRVRYWDLASTEKKISGKKSNDPDFTVGSRISATTDGKFVIEHQESGQWSWGMIKQKIVETALNDGSTIPIYIEQEPGAGGKNQVAEFQEMLELAAYTIKPHSPVGDKIQRANPWFARAASGLMWIVAGEWTTKFLNELDNFPTSGTHDDTIDSVSGAFQVLSPFKAWAKVPFIHMSMSPEELEKALHE